MTAPAVSVFPRACRALGARLRPSPVFALSLALLLAATLPLPLSAQAPAKAPATAAALPAFDFLYGDHELYPSALICLTGEKF